MGVLPVGKLLITMSLPMIISMLIQALYNVVDSYYVAQIGEHALTSVSLAFPMQQLIISVATGTGVGINALLSRFLGAKQFEKANNVAKHAIFLAVISAVVTSVLMLLLAEPFMSVQTDDPDILRGGVTYLRICGGIPYGIYFAIFAERLLTSTGLTVYTMITQVIGAVLNIVFDPILIFGLGPFPELGIAGAAYATVFGQVVSAIIGILLNIRKNKEISIQMRGFRPDGRLIGSIYRIGVPSIIMAAIGSVMTFGFNLILMQYLKNSTAAAVFGVYFKLNSLFFMPLFGMNNGLVPIVAYNYGAEHKSRIREAFKWGLVFAYILMIGALLAFWIVPGQLLSIFNASENMLSIGIPALRIISVSYLAAGYCIVSSSVMQALGNAFYSMINSITRQLVFLLPAAFILAMIFREQGGLPAVWYSYDIAEISSFILVTVFLRRTWRDKIAPLPE